MNTIKFVHLDRAGKEIEETSDIFNVDRESIIEFMDTNLPISQIGSDSFRDLSKGDVIDFWTAYQRYIDVINFGDAVMGGRGGVKKTKIPKINCVFIETQRLILSQRERLIDDDIPSPKEEILRQAAFLSKLLDKTHSSYAAIAQSLDRSFPNRLVDGAGRTRAHDLPRLKADLADIQDRRRALTEAGILDEISEPVVAPTDEFMRTLADALEIYIEDSKKKLSSFDELYRKVHVFQDLLSKKIRPKILSITRSRGVEIRRSNDIIGLEKLSSGEKHEFIMLFKLIFETPENSLVLIDEPEISLHVSWQLEFMTDLAKIQQANNFQCIIATHSPQIIQGAEDITFDLSEQTS